jgi:hypothetical protein
MADLGMLSHDRKLPYHSAVDGSRPAADPHCDYPSTPKAYFDADKSVFG